MKVTFDFSGGDELRRKLENASKTTNVGFLDLFNKQFVRANTPYSDIEEMLEAADVNTSSVEEMKALGNHGALNKLVREKTKFNNWDDMLMAAGAEYTAKSLGFK